MINGIDTYKSVNGFSTQELQMMEAFLQGAVYCWCKNVGSDNWFAARDILGGKNYYWQGTPLYRLYEYYLAGDNSMNEYAIEEAGKAAGRLLKKVLIEDKRIFNTREGYTREYCWTGEEIN